MENIITVLQQIFMGKEDNSARVGLSEFKNSIQNQTSVQKTAMSSKKPQELRLSELMRKAY